MRHPLHILLVEDNAGDVKLTRMAIERGGKPDSLQVVGDGVEALSYLRRELPYDGALRPDLVLLDLNLPRMDGAEVLREVKADPALERIPVVILTSSEARDDIERCYGLRANAYVTKPVELRRYMAVVQNLGEFWASLAQLPRG